jgi:hypothetical protein
MTYQELISKMQKFSLIELEKFRDTLEQQIVMVYETGAPDPEALKADLKDQLNAIKAELIRRKNRGEKYFTPRGAGRKVRLDDADNSPKKASVGKLWMWLALGFIVYFIIKGMKQ